MNIPQTLGVLNMPAALPLKKAEQQEQKDASFSTVAEAIKPNTNLIKATATDTTNSTEEKSALQALQEYMELSPAEQIRLGMLNELGLTEEELESLPFEEQQAIELKIAQRIKDTLGADASLLSDNAVMAPSINMAGNTSQQGMDQAIRLYQAISQSK